MAEKEKKEEKRKLTDEEVTQCLDGIEELNRMDMARIFTNQPDHIYLDQSYPMYAAFHSRFSKLGGIDPYIKSQLAAEEKAANEKAKKDSE